MKKLLSVMLVLILLLSSIYTGAWADGSSTPVGTNLMANIKASDWISGWGGTASEEINGVISVSAAWRSVYTKVTLAPGTKHTLTFSFGQTRVGDVRVYPASEITDPETQLKSVGSEPTKGGTTNLASESITCSITSGAPVDGEFYEASESFTTTAETEYYIILDCFQCADSKNCVLLKDFNIVSIDPNTEISDPANWKSTRGTLGFKASTESYAGGKGVTTDTTNTNPSWVDTYAKVTLKPNTKYTLSFAYKGETVLTNFYIMAVSDSSYTSGFHICNTLVGGAAYLFSQNVKTSGNASTWHQISAGFTTKNDTEYYIVFDHGANTTGFTASDFSFTAVEVDKTVNVLENTVPTDWTSSWEGRVGTYEKVIAVKNAWRSAYTKITLAPNTNYDFTFKASTVKVSNVRVFAESEITDVEAQLRDSSTHVKGGTNDLVNAFSTTAPADNYASATPELVNKYYNVSASFATNTTDTEYYIIVDAQQFLDNGTDNPYCSCTHMKNLSLVSKGEVYIDPNKLSDATVANGDVRWSVGADEEDYYITGAEGKEEELVTYAPNGEEITISRVYYYDSKTQGTYNGGYAWRIIISHEEAMNVYNPAVYGYITAKGLAANTKYTFSYIYTDTYHVKLADVYNESGSVVFSDVNTKLLDTKNPENLHSYMVTANFTTGAEGDYTIKLQTGRSDKYYIYDSSSWAMTVSDLSLIEYEETETVVIPDDANILEDLNAFDWEYTWSKDGEAYKLTVDNNALNFNGIQHHGVYTMLELAPNTEYELTFNYISSASIDVVGITDAANVKLENVDRKLSGAIVKGGNITYYQNIEKVDARTTKNATVKFVTGDSTTYYLYLEGNSDKVDGLSGATVISDMSLKKVLDNFNATVVDYDFEDGNIGAVSTTHTDDTPSIVEENGNKYLTFTRTHDGITVPFYYRANQKYVVSFDMKVLTAPTATLQFRFKTSEGNNNLKAYQGNVFTYNNNAYSLVTKDLNGNLLSGPAGLNNADNYQFNGYKQDIENHTDWVHYEITIDPDYTYYTGLANFGFDAGEAGWSIALDNIKVAALNDEFEADAEAKFEPTKYAAIRAKAANQKQGIRVKSSIDTSLLEGDIKVVEYGTLAINNSKLGGKELVYDMVNSADYGAKKGVAYSAEDETNVIFEQEGSVVTFTGTLIGLADYTTDYAVRGYMIAETADGERFVIYEEDTKTVSVYDVVYAILNDGKTNDDDTVAEAIVSNNQAEYDSFVEENYAEETIASDSVNLKVYNSAENLVIDNYRGFSGTVYHAFGFMEDDVTGRVYDADMINTELDRLEDAGVHYVRTRYQSQWIFDDATGYDWNSDRFNYFLNYAKALQERDMEVILQVGWHFDFISQDGDFSIRENDYFNGEGDDRYGESAGVDFTDVSDDNARIIRAAYRYAYLMANTVKLARAKGINNIKYFSYFVEPSNTYSKNEGQIIVKAGHDKEQYVLFCENMINAVENIHSITDIKHMGPNEAGYSKLTEYVVNYYPNLFDIITAHNYPEEGDVATNYNKYYETMTDNTNRGKFDWMIGNGYMTDFNDYADFLEIAQEENPNAEFWCDEFNIKDFDAYQGRGTSSFYRGLATAMGGIVAQQSGIQNTILWMSYDQLWTDNTGGTETSESEFMNGIHQCGNAPSLFLSDQPYAQYYPTTLFSKYNGYKDGKVYATNLSSTATQGVYVGAVQLENGDWTVSVLNMNSTAVEITVDFDTAINQTLYRHVVSADKADTYADAKIPDADKAFTNVAASFNDVLPAGSFAVYTSVK